MDTKGWEAPTLFFGAKPNGRVVLVPVTSEQLRSRTKQFDHFAARMLAYRTSASQYPTTLQWVQKPGQVSKIRARHHSNSMVLLIDRPEPIIRTGPIESRYMEGKVLYVRHCSLDISSSAVCSIMNLAAASRQTADSALPRKPRRSQCFQAVPPIDCSLPQETHYFVVFSNPKMPGSASRHRTPGCSISGTNCRCLLQRNYRYGVLPILMPHIGISRLVRNFARSIPHGSSRRRKRSKGTSWRLKNVRVKRRTRWSSKPLQRSRLPSVSFLKISHHRDQYRHPFLCLARRQASHLP